jgi:large subunit ribosomal protein L21
MTYAIISLGGKQYRVREGERLLVDRLPYEEGKVFHPDLLLVGGDGEARFDGKDLKDQQVTARVAAHVLGEKITVVKHRQRTRYRRRKGHRSHLSQIEIESIGKKATRARSKASESGAEEKKTTRKTAKKQEGSE